MDNNELAKRYIKVCWIIKIRLISCRIGLWGNSFSHIQFENCLLQIRKIIEGYSQLNLLLSHIEFEDVPRKFGSYYEVPRIINGLRKAERKQRLSRARIELVAEEANRNIWHMNLEEVTDDEEDRLIDIWRKSGRWLHEESGFGTWPYPEAQAHYVLGQNLNALRSDHQWIWNLLWSHYASFTKTEVFCVQFGEKDYLEKPILIKPEGQFDVTDVDFDPKFLGDMPDKIDWSFYDD